MSTGCVAELNIGELLSGLHDEVLVTEGVCKNDVAAGVGKLLSSGEALVILGDVGLDENLVILEAELSLGIFESLDEVVVVC